MIVILSILLLLAIILKFFTPEKPNYLFGYQLGSAKKSVKHWKVANSYASNYMIVFYGLILGLALLFDNQKYDGDMLLLILLVVGFVVMYISIEKKLKKIVKPLPVIAVWPNVSSPPSTSNS
jgi:uncharacterized membrane protein